MQRLGVLGLAAIVSCLSACATEGGDAEGGSSGDPSATDPEEGGGDTNADDSTAGDAPEVPDVAYCDPVSGWQGSWSVLEVEILEHVNARRAEGADCGAAGMYGPVGPLTMQPALRCAARVHSKQMVEQEFFDHVTPAGEEPWDRMDAAGYRYSSAGENIAAGNPTAADTMQQWMDSDGHCRNIMSPDFTELGVGYFAGGFYGHMWTQAFGRP